jgi:hypothetical protein
VKRVYAIEIVVDYDVYGVCTLFTGQREREKERKREGESYTHISLFLSLTATGDSTPAL